jgi:hypothetical protein
MRALEDVVRQGKARFVGLSNFKGRDRRAQVQRRRVSTAGTCSTGGCSAIFILPGGNGVGVMAWIARLRSADGHVHPQRSSAPTLARARTMGSIKLFDTLFGPECFRTTSRWWMT